MAESIDFQVLTQLGWFVVSNTAWDTHLYPFSSVLVLFCSGFILRAGSPIACNSNENTKNFKIIFVSSTTVYKIIYSSIITAF
jgi:hypothetical protein